MFYVHHWECTPSEYVERFESLEEAQKFVEEFGEVDEFGESVLEITEVK